MKYRSFKLASSIISLTMAILASSCSDLTKEQLITGEMNRENRQLLQAYGKVVDQNGNPIPNVKVHCGVLINVGFESSGSKEYTAETDAQGLFQFTDLHGVRLGFGFEKAGYEYNPGLYVTWWNSYKPDPKNPAVFIMYKLQGAEPTISGDKFWGINPDGRVFTIDLIKNKKIEGGIADGDLRVTINGPGEINRNQKFDWSFSLEAINGGVIQTSDAYLNEAPEKGYQNKFTVTMSAADPKWSREFQGVFYLKSRDGKVYGHITIEVIPVYNDTAVFNVQSLVNPSGSRNLEFDPAKQIKTP